METIARPYARAVFAVAQQSKNATEWLGFLENLAAALKNKELLGYMKNPLLNNQAKADFLFSVAEGMKSKVSDEQKRFLELLVRYRRVDCLPAIAKLFAISQQQAENFTEVFITSAHELSDQEKADLEGSLVKRIGKKVRIKEQIDQSLLGGAVIEWDDKIIDGSVRGKLEKLTARL